MPRDRMLLRRLMRSLAMTAGYFGIAAGAVKPEPAAAQDAVYQKPEAVPAAWREYAERVQTVFRQLLDADDDMFRQFQTRGDDSTNARAASSVIVRAWIANDGKVERVELVGLDGQPAMSLRSVLAKGNIGAPPPPGMLQPLNLRLSLADKG